MRNSLLFLSFFIILSFGFSTVWSTAPSLAINQLTFILAAIFVIILSLRFDLGLYKSLSIPAYLFIIFLLVLTFALGQVTRGTISWIAIGPFHLQASEIAKPVIILTFAHLFSLPIFHPLRWLISRILLFLPVVGLVVFQPDLGSAIIIAIIWIGMLFYSPLPKDYLFKLVLLGLILVPVGLQFLQPYQRDRLLTFVNPYGDPTGSGYNVIQSQIAVGSGQIIGKGVRQGTQSHLRFLPERHTDFAFASFAEEFGFIGSFFLFASFFYVLYWLTKQIKHQDLFETLIIVGAFWQFFSQTIINLGMNLGLMPVTGITLPLFSYGGSSLLSFGLTLGLVFSTLKKEN